jgi:hypothetical protein
VNAALLSRKFGGAKAKWEQVFLAIGLESGNLIPQAAWSKIAVLQVVAMAIPLNFLKAAAKAVVKHVGNGVGFGFVGDLLVEYGVPIVEDLWEAWGKNKKEADIEVTGRYCCRARNLSDEEARQRTCTCT